MFGMDLIAVTYPVVPNVEASCWQKKLKVRVGEVNSCL